jgi:hypothetical protein
VFGRWLHLATFLKVDTQPLSEAWVYRWLTLQTLFAPIALIAHFDLGLLVQNHGQQGHQVRRLSPLGQRSRSSIGVVGLACAMKNDAAAKQTEAVKMIPSKGSHV